MNSSRPESVKNSLNFYKKSHCLDINIINIVLNVIHLFICYVYYSLSFLVYVEEFSEDFLLLLLTQFSSEVGKYFNLITRCCSAE